jgi:hypothetical protein
MNYKPALVTCLLAMVCLSGCDGPNGRDGTHNPDSTFRESASDRPKKIEPDFRPPPEPRVHPLTKVLQSYPKDDYEVAVLYMYEIMHTPDATQAICARWFPVYGRETADAVMAWQKKEEPLISEIRDRTHAIWIGQADGDASVVPWATGRFDRDRRQQFDNAFDKTPVKVYEKRCADLPRSLRSSEWDLRKRFRTQLAVVRKRPMSEVMAGTAATAAN